MKEKYYTTLFYEIKEAVVLLICMLFLGFFINTIGGLAEQITFFILSMGFFIMFWL